MSLRNTPLGTGLLLRCNSVGHAGVYWLQLHIRISSVVNGILAIGFCPRRSLRLAPGGGEMLIAEERAHRWMKPGCGRSWATRSWTAGM